MNKGSFHKSLFVTVSDLAGCSVQPYAEPVAKVLNHQLEKIFGTSDVGQIDFQSLNDQYLKARGKELMELSRCGNAAS